VLILLEILSQPIVNLITGEKVMEERLSRPDCPIKDYFSTKDRSTLLRREIHAILQCIEERGEVPYTINITPYTLPIFCRLPIFWTGGIEIVEWDKSILPYFKPMKVSIKVLQSRGLSVWADDITPGTVDMWLKAGVTGFKVELKELTNNELFVKQLRTTQKPVIVERIETEDDHKFVKSIGITLGQGYYYGRPKRREDYISWTMIN